MDAHFDMAVLQGAERQCIVKIPGIFGVYRKSRHPAHVAAAGDFFLWDAVGQYLGFVEHLIGEKQVEPVVDEDGLHLDIVATRFAQHIDDAAGGVLVGCPFPLFDTDHYLVAVGSMQGTAGPHDNIQRHEGIRCDDGIAGVLPKRADELFAGALQHFHDLPFETAAAAQRPGAQAYPVAVQGGAHVRSRDKDIFFLAFDHDVGGTAAGHIHDTLAFCLPGTGGRAGRQATGELVFEIVQGHQEFFLY